MEEGKPKLMDSLLSLPSANLEHTTPTKHSPVIIFIINRMGCPFAYAVPGIYLRDEPEKETSLRPLVSSGIDSVFHTMSCNPDEKLL